jgi:hypothetical protein
LACGTSRSNYLTWRDCLRGHCQALGKPAPLLKRTTTHIPFRTTPILGLNKTCSLPGSTCPLKCQLPWTPKLSSLHQKTYGFVKCRMFQLAGPIPWLSYLLSFPVTQHNRGRVAAHSPWSNLTCRQCQCPLSMCCERLVLSTFSVEPWGATVTGENKKCALRTQHPYPSHCVNCLSHKAWES